MMAVVAAETQKRSERSSRGVGFARGQGHRDAPGMVEKQSGVSGPEARRLIELGETLADAERAAARGQDGEHAGLEAGQASRDPGKDPGPDALPRADDPPAGRVFVHVAAASREGRLGAEAASAITRMLRGVASRADADLMVEAEKDLVFSAGLMSVYRLGQAINRWRDRLDADHLEELAAERRERRFLHVGENADGMIRVNGQLDPENGAPLMAVMGAMVNQHFRTNKTARDAIKKGLVASVDDRTPGQVCADAMGAFARHLAGCDVEVLPHASAQVIVTMEYDTMLAAAKGDSVVGATIEGLSSTPDAAELRRVMARAGLIPKVLGGGSCTLDLGYRARSFSQPQRDAILDRDGGCVKCSAPAVWADVHHIVPHEFGGRSDLDNAVTLCVKCHHDIHREGWTIVATHTEVWLIPPAHLDPERTPQPAGRRLFDATAIYGDHLPDPADVIARTPIAATKVGDHRRRQAPPSQQTRTRPPEVPGRQAHLTERPDTPRRPGTSACAMAPAPRSCVLVESTAAATERAGTAIVSLEGGADDASAVTGAMSRALSVARRQPPHARAGHQTRPRARHPRIRVQSFPQGLGLSHIVLARGPG